MTDVDLTNCDREPIHLLGAIQPFGFLLAVTRQWMVAHASDNAQGFLGQAAEDLIGRSLTEVLDGHAVHEIRGRLQIMRGADSVERVFNLALQAGGEPFDVAVHYSGDLLIIEAEPSRAESSLEAASAVRSMANRVAERKTIEDIVHEAARQVRALTEFDRVMVYRFDHDGAGEVIAESVRPGIGSFLGQRYPASDIPQQARALYERSWLRIIADIDAETPKVRPALGPSGGPLDLSMSMLRAVSPIHIEYLRNMGVGASLSISILRQGKLWGLFACHHYGPHHVSYERRTAAELFGQIFSYMLESREQETEARHVERARNLHDRLVSSVATASGPASLTPFLGELCSLAGCEGVTLHMGGQTTSHGASLDADRLKILVGFLDDHATRGVFHTHHLAAHLPEAKTWQDAAGIIAVPLSREPGDYLIFQRGEVVREVAWAGDPNKAVTVGPLGARLTPRQSFETWKETVRGQSRPWSASELAAVDSLRLTLLEVVMRLTDLANAERGKAQHRQEVLIAELNHRVRNILGLIRGLISQSRDGATTVQQFFDVVSGRVQALARAHDQITQQHWGPGALTDLIRGEAEAYLAAKADRLILSGPDVLIEPQAFSTLSLVIHELVTNSAKYGALCDSRGEVHVSWTTDASGALDLAWREQGGPTVKAPTRRGFGSTIIERSIPHELGGEAEVTFDPAGLRVALRVPGRFVVEGRAADPGKAVAPVADERPPRPNHVLVVEDNMIIALDLEGVLLKLGASQVSMASNVAAALEAIAADRPDFAFLDLNLGEETSLPVAEQLQAEKISFAFGTGFGDQADLPEHLSAVPIISKPYSEKALRDVLKAASSQRR
ncbi:HWE histidine kinase domain-containing protein [Phenylobacterium sp.]|uniref:HWE histidine kinase domain-containing protein n=1 Tax=Phenylobacterium sp. TaxID=1871053 RepID=UPI002731199E|nr:HWE histidine kinase domain-containing protein [Phenylobacterium sp.]MDP1617452.1 HWE histidine kinase domain-containing protein [Phenylobacterium sp.]MDP1988789.1 HWE histidine kinase domain-containing protein [Phenylobacterium sp.]